MIRVRLINEGKVVKQITSRLHESVVLAQIEKYKDPFDSVQVVEGELSEDAKDMLHRVAKKIIPAAMAAGVALGGAGNAQAQGGANPNYPGLNYSIGDHVRDIVSPNYRERVRQREHQRSTERQVWDAEQNEIRKQRIQAARAKAQQHSAQNQVYDQARNSGDGKFIIIYGMDDRVTRIPAKGTEFMPADSQRMAHYITPNGRVYYVRHPHTAGIAQSISKESVTEAGTIGTVGTIPASGTTSMTQKTKFAPTGKTTDVTVNDNGELELADPNALDLQTKQKMAQAGLKVAEAFGSNYAEQLAQQVYENDPELDASGEADEVMAAGFAIAREELGIKRARHTFAYDEDFPSDFVSAYAYLQQNGSAHVDEGAELKQAKRKYNQAAKDANADQVGAGKKIDTMKKSLRQKDLGKEKTVDEGYLDNPGKEDSPVAQAVIRRILMQRTDLLAKYGPEKVGQAVDDVADWVGDVDEIGSSDVSAWVKDVERNLSSMGESISEAEHGLDAILDQYAENWAKFKAGGDLDENPDFFEALFNYYADSGEMPYGTQKARTGDPVEWLTMKMDAVAGNDPVAEAEDDDEASAADQAAADKNIIMQIRRAADYEKPTQLELGDGTRAMIDARTARALLAQFDKLRPDSKMMMQQALNTFQGFDELSKHFGGGIRKEAITRVGKIMADAFKESRKGRV